MDWVTLLHTLNALLAAGIGIMAAGLWVYTLSFNLRVRVARAFSLVLLSLVPLYAGEALASVEESPALQPMWIRVLWTGLAFLPATLLHFSDAVLEATGRPSRGRRVWAVRLAYGVALGFAVAMWWPRPLVLGEFRAEPAPHARGGPWAWSFILYYASAMLFGLINLWRAYRRAGVRVSRRRLAYLMAGAWTIAVGSFPYLTFGENLAGRWVALFWLLGTLNQLMVAGLLVLMAYATAFFGVTLPDRLVQQRLVRWILQGPLTVILTLTAVTWARRWGQALWDQPYGLWVPLTLVVTLLFLHWGWVLFLPLLERWWPGDPLAPLLHPVRERLFTIQDVRQFLEALLSLLCERLEVDRALLVVFEEQQAGLVVRIGPWGEEWPQPVLQNPVQQPGYFVWDGYWLRGLHHRQHEQLLGLLVFPKRGEGLTKEEQQVVEAVVERALVALEAWQQGREALQTLQRLVHQPSLFARLHAVARFDRSQALAPEDQLPPSSQVFRWVWDALKHYWGGPKLSNNPLIRWRVVQEAAARHGGNTIQGLREVLREAIERLRPPGERRFTAEWLLYNILEMKFFQGRKVRDIALKLALSEADFYRKQRIALEQVARELLAMEAEARRRATQETPDSPDAAPDSSQVPAR